MGYALDEIEYHKLTELEKGDVIKRVKNMLEADERVKLACLFGSFTRRDSLRDIDLAVYAAPPLSFDELLSLGARMELELNIPVDLVQLQDLDPAFRLKVLRRASRILVKEKHLYQRLVALAFEEFLDLRMHESMSSGTQMEFYVNRFSK